MALTRKMLKAMGIEEEKIDQIIEAHTETVDALKEQRDTYKKDAEKLPDIQRELEDLKAEGDDGYKEKYEKEHEAFENFKKAQTERENEAAKKSAYRDLLKAAGISEKRLDAVLKISDISTLTLEEGKFKDADKLTESIKAEWADFIVEEGEKGADPSNPPKKNDHRDVDLGKLSMEEYIEKRSKKG
ncbi:MAG: hypothetical protein IJM99_09225 [Firmicutes bacterium]|nr:hypothetical protein [Bacillota bacterium]